MTGFEGIGDFDGDPLERYNAHQAAKGRVTMADPDALRKRLRENHPDPVDAEKDARSEARYEVDPQAEKDDVWRETNPAKGSGAGDE